MDDDQYTTYEAKARFSEVLKKVRSGRTVTVTYHGEPVAEIRPLDRDSGTPARLEWLRSRGVLGSPGARLGKLAAVASKPGALKRFLAERE